MAMSARAAGNCPDVIILASLIFSSCAWYIQVMIYEIIFKASILMYRTSTTGSYDGSPRYGTRLMGRERWTGPSSTGSIDVSSKNWPMNDGRQRSRSRLCGPYCRNFKTRPQHSEFPAPLLFVTSLPTNL